MPNITQTIIGSKIRSALIGVMAVVTDSSTNFSSQKLSLKNFMMSSSTNSPSNNKPVELCIAIVSLLCAISFACLALFMCFLYARKASLYRALKDSVLRSPTLNNTNTLSGGYFATNTLSQSQATSSRSFTLTNEYDVNVNDPSEGVAASSGLSGQERLSRASFLEPTYSTPEETFPSSVSAPEKEPFLGKSASNDETCILPRVGSQVASSSFSRATTMSVSTSSATRQAIERSMSLRPAPGLKQKPQSRPPPPPSQEISFTSEGTYEQFSREIELTQLGDGASSSAAAAEIRSSSSASATADCPC